MDTPVSVETDWPYLLTLLPEDLEQTARATRAFCRPRGVQSAANLLRLALAYASGKFSLRTLAAWAAAQGCADLSDVALLNRLRGAAPWLGLLVTQFLARRLALPPPGAHPLRVRLLDATTVSRPGSHGTDWRLHVGFDLQRLLLDEVELTDATGGESFKRGAVTPGEVAVGDRGYAHRPGIVQRVLAGGQVLVRLNWQNVPLQHPDGQPFDLLGALRTLPAAGMAEFAVQTAPDPRQGLPAVPGRFVAVQKSPQQAETARRKLHQAARKHGKTPDARTVEAAGYVFLFTTVPAAWLPLAAVLELYRFRWQVELAFKRMKSLLELDELTAKDPALCRTFLFAKLLLTLLTEDLSRECAAFSPWGYGLPTARVPVAGDAAGLCRSVRGHPPGAPARAVAGARGCDCHPVAGRPAAPPAANGPCVSR